MSEEKDFDELIAERNRAEAEFAFNPTAENKAAYEKAYHEAAMCYIGSVVKRSQELRKKMKEKRQKEESESRKTEELGRAFCEGLAEGMKIKEKE